MWRRIAFRAVLGLAVLAATASAAVLSLRLPQVRQRILARVAAAVERETGLRFAARDFQLGLRDGVLAVDGLVLGARGHEARPILTAERARLAVRWRSLGSRRVVLPEVRLEGVRLDLGAPRPTPGGRAGEPRDRSSRRDVEILDLSVIGGTVQFPEIAGVSRPLFAVPRLDEARARGSFRSGVLQVRLEEARFVVDTPGGKSVVGALRAAFSISAEGAELSSLELRGEGLTLDASGWRSGASGPLRCSFTLELEPGRLLPQLARGGRIGAEGEIELSLEERASGSASLRVEAREVPGEVLEPWIGRVPLAGVATKGTRIDLDGDVEIRLAWARPGFSPTLEALGGAVRGVWSREGMRVLTASLRARAPDAEPAAARAGLDFDVELLPATPGHRRIRGTLVAPSWSELRRGELRGARLEVLEPDLAGHLALLGVAPRPFGEARAEGELRAVVEAEGPLAALRWRGEGSWRRGEERLLTVSARSLAAEGRELVRFDFQGSVLPDRAGRRDLSGVVAARSWTALRDAELHDVRALVHLPDVPAVVPDLRRVLGALRPSVALPPWFEGALVVALRASGPLARPEVEVEGRWLPAEGETVEFEARGRFPWDRLELRDLTSATLTARDLRLSRFGVEPIGALSFEARLLAETRSIELSGISGVARSVRFTGEGIVDAAWPPRRAELRLAVEQPRDDIERVEASLRLVAGSVELRPLRIEYGQATATVEGTVPLGALAPLPPLARRLVPEPTGGPLSLTFSGVEIGPLVERLELARRRPLPRFRGTARGRLIVEPRRIPRGSGSVEIDGFAVEAEGGSAAAREPVRLELGGGRVGLSPARLEVSGPALREPTALDLSGELRLAPDWQWGRSLGALVGELSVEARGTVDASFFSPWFNGPLGTGPVTVEATARGPWPALSAKVQLGGPEASFLYRSPYPTRIEAPEVELVAREGAARIHSARATVNGGELELRGDWDLREGFRLDASFRGVHYRLPYDVTTRVGGELEVTWPREGRRRIAGEVRVERALLRRDLNLDRELLSAVLEPELESAREARLDRVDLDLQIVTDEGLQIKNATADLHAAWDQIHVGGTLAHPRLTGHVDIDPGGRANLFGHVVRIDAGKLSWYGDPPSSPQAEFETTSSLEDPTLLQGWRGPMQDLGARGPGIGGALDLRSTPAAGAQNWESLAAGTVAYYQGRVAGALGRATSGTELSVGPLPLFGETDTEARFTVAQRVSPNVTFVASDNPREAEGQTYILDLHDVDVAPSLRTQIFTNDERNEGATLQQTLAFGAGPRDPARRLRDLVIQAPREVSRRRLRRAIGLREGDPVLEGTAFEAEVDAADALRRMGYPAALVTAMEKPAGHDRVKLRVVVEPGLRVRAVFEGDRPPRAARRAIAALYLPGPEEPASLGRIRDETASVLRGRGYLSPRVEVTVDRETEPAVGGSAATLRVRSAGGRRVDPERPVFRGLPEADAARLAALFASRLARVELAAGLPEADGRLLEQLGVLGYPGARIVSRDLSDDGRRLELRIDPGQRQRVRSVQLVGVEPPDAVRLAAVLGLAEGEPVDRDRIARGRRAIEEELRRRGHAEAKARAIVEPAGPEPSTEVDVRIEITPGPLYRLDSVRFEGLRDSSPSWVEGVAGLRSGGAFDRGQVAEARGRLFRTGVFRRIHASSYLLADQPALPAEEGGDPAGSAGTAATAVSFDLEERPRYQISYGGRWENGEGVGAVADFMDGHSFGRGHLTGVRAIYGGEERSLRLYHLVPNLAGERSALELFVQGARETDRGVIIDSVKSWAQLTFPVGRRVRNRVYAVLEDRDLAAQTPDAAPLLDQREISPRFGWQFAYDSRKQGLLAQRRRGLFFGLDASGSHTGIGGDVTAGQVFSRVTTFVPFGRGERRKYTWAQSLRLSWVDAVGSEVPLEDRVRAGGEFSVRGYSPDSLGPLDPEGRPLGGEALAAVNHELHRRLAPTLSALAFFDAGNVWESVEAIEPRLFKSWGLGLRYASPVGPLRLDLAFPLDQRRGDPDYKIYFGFGNLF
jgi:translocation and assembly module TamA